MLNKICLLLALFASVGQAATKTHTIIMKSISFDPKVVVIAVGESVDWQNESYTDHSATADDERTFDTGLVPPKHHSTPIVFKKPGTYAYHCRMHGKTMSGTIEAK